MAKKIKRIAYVRCRGGSVSCTYGCIGCGMCAEACRLGAISVGENSIAAVDTEKCVGCGLCAKACPQGIIDIVGEGFNIQPACSNKDAGKAARDACINSCIACRLCEKNCPADAVHVTDNRAVIDPDKCICCGMCAVKCPRGVIRDLHGIMTD
jgi:ferredoxin